MDKINYNLILDTDNLNTFDLTLVTDATLNLNKGSLNHNLRTDCLAFYYDFSIYSDINNIYSLENYSGATCSGITLYDIGLTGVDNGYVSNLTGETLIFTSASTLTLKPVTGNSANYNLGFSMDSNLGIQVLSLSGGFYQGFYKLAGYDYEMIPNRTPEGFTLNFWLALNDDGNSVNSGLTSSNFYYFQGTRAENKFHNIFSGETGITTSSSITLSSQSGGTTDINGFGLYYNYNYLGVKIIINRQDESGNTEVSIFDTGTTVTIGSANTWTNITVTFTRDQPLTLDDSCGCLIPTPIIVTEYADGCSADVPPTQSGVLKFYINGRPVFSQKIEEPIFRKLVVDPTVQQGVPYNISIGGGTQGLFETQTFGGPDFDDQDLTMFENFGGTFNGKISIASMYTYPFSLPEIIGNFYAKRDIYKLNDTFGGPKIIINKSLTK